MDNTTTYIVVIAAYFIVMLLVGIFCGKRASNSEQDYFIAKNKLPAIVLGFSFSATQMSGSTYMGVIGTRRLVGFANVPSAASACWFTYILVGDRIRKLGARLELSTVADVLEARFGKLTGLVASIIILVCSIPTVMTQFQAAGTAFTTLIGMNYLLSLLLFGGIVLIYTLMGGMFAVAWTDLIQGFFMILGFVILTPICVSAVGGFVQVHINYAAFNPKGIQFSNSSRTVIWMISNFISWAILQTGGMPAAVTRFLSTTDDKKFKHALAYSAVFQAIVFSCTMIIALASATLLPTLANADMVVPQLSKDLLHPILGGIVLAAALAAMMSTVDSVILMCSSIFVTNIMEKGFKLEKESKASMMWSKVVVIVVGVLGLVFAINPPDSILWIMTTGFSIMGGAFTVPMIAALWWPRCSSAGGLAGIVGGGVASTAWYIMSFSQYGNLNTFIGGWWPGIVGTIVSLVLLVVVSLITKPCDDSVLSLFYDEA